MLDDGSIAEAALLVDSFGPTSPLVRLARLASPACRVEPQLLRRLRLDCVPEADVSVEQELWFSDLVASRGQAITFSDAVSRVLRSRLREGREREDATVAKARRAIAELHRDLPRVLRLEDELAWAEIYNDDETIRTMTDQLLGALLAGRDGLDQWLARAWPNLPAGLKRTPQGEQLAEVAAARGAIVDPVSTGSHAPNMADFAHLLPLATVLLARDRQTLRIKVRPDEATHAIDVPDTRSQLLSVRTADTTWSGPIAGGHVTTLDIGTGAVALLTEAGAEYELEADTEHALFDIEMLPADHGTSLMISFDDADRTHFMLVDTGTRRTGELIEARLRDGSTRSIDVLVLTHIDSNSVAGAIELLRNDDVELMINDVWFNGFEDLGQS